MGRILWMERSNRIPENRRSHPVFVDDGIKTVKHEVSNDNDPAVIEWLKKTTRASILVEDIKNMSDAAVYNLLSNSSVMRPVSKVAVCGWVCHDACRAQLLQKYDGRTGDMDQPINQTIHQ